MRLTEIETIKPNQVKFWYNVNTGEFIEHNDDVHHPKVVAKNPDKFGVNKSKIIHNPYVAGSPNKFGDMKDEDTTWTEPEADNDYKVSNAAQEKGWVRGGHIFDREIFKKYNRIVSKNEIYLQSYSFSDAKIAMIACLSRWPNLKSAIIEFRKPYINFLQLKNRHEIDEFINKKDLN
ncbi:MAG: hypothetical protein WC284_14940 [Candidimonas sp.]